MTMSEATWEACSDSENVALGPLNDDARLELNAILERCTKALLGSYGVDARRTETSDIILGSSWLAFVGFFGDRLRGTLIVDACRAALARSYPVGGHTPDDADLGDWSGELANLLLGRLKGELLGRGVAIWLGTPTVVSVEGVGAADSLYPVDRMTCMVEAGGAWMRSRLEVTAEARFSLAIADTPRPSLSPANCGDAFLFD